MLENLEPTVKVLSCKVRKVLEELDPKDRTILENAMNDDKWTAWSLSASLANRGLILNDKAIRRHQLKQCSCQQLGK
jgi:hypothetical protein